MQIKVTGRHVKVNDQVRAYIDDKAGKLTKFYDRIHEIEVIVDHEAEQFKLEIIVRADQKNTFVAHDSGPETMVLVDQVVDKLERQLRRHKEKTRDHKHDGKTDTSGDVVSE